MLEKKLTQEYLCYLFEYKEGNLYWKNLSSKYSNTKVGNKVGGSRPINQYLYIRLLGKRCLAHRLIFLHQKGYLPNFLDHIDGNRKNNCIENLRECSIAENSFNKKLTDKNTSGYKNVSWSTQRKKWRVQMVVFGKSMGFGFYDDIELADLVAQEARNKYHGKFARDK
jgi:hypothetical protein